MDQVHEKNETQDARDLLEEILKVQELILRRLDRLEDTVRALEKK